MNLNLNTWLTLDELAAYLKLSRAKLYQMSRDAEIPVSKIGNQWRFNQEEIDTWMKSQRSNHAGDQPEVSKERAAA